MAVLDAFGIERTDLVGASVGDLWALRFAELAPERVDSVVLLGGGPIAPIEVPGVIRLIASPLGALIVRLPEPPAAARAQLRGLGHGASLDAGRMDGYLGWRSAFSGDTPSMRHERDMIRALVDGRSWRPGALPTDADLVRIDRPVRMLFGTSDPTGSVSFWRAFVERLPAGELDIVDGAGHLLWWDDPEHVAGSVRTGLTAVNPSPIAR
jgi:pimeloyl-ACP methyl ester carboxylesterase